MPPPEMFGVFRGDQRFAHVEAGELGFRQQRMALAEADLRQARAGARDDREGARADLQIERTGIAGRDLVELLAVVGHHAGEDVEAAGRALRVGGGGDLRRQGEAFQQRHDVDAAGLEHGAVASGRSRAASAGRACRRPYACLAGQEAGAHAPGLVAEPEIEAGRLDLVGVERARGNQPAAPEKAPRSVDREGFPLAASLIAPLHWMRRRLTCWPIDASSPRV